MKRILVIFTVLAYAVMAGGCATAWKNVAYTDDLYSIHNKIAIANRQKAEAELAKAQYEAEQAQYEAALARVKAEAAKQGGFDYFTTTLSISPLKDAQRLNAIGGRLADEVGVPWLFSDFKKKNGYRRSCELSQQYGLYRQDYCGCIYSKLERDRRVEARTAASGE